MRRKGGSKGGDPAPIAVLIVFVFSVALLAAIPANGEEEELAPLLINGFTATHAAGDAASAPFEPVVYAPNRAFAFGFLRVGAASLDLAVVHLPSSFPVWRATPARTGDWSRPATLTFDTSLVLTDPDRGELWRTPNAVGDTVALLNSSNLVVRRYGDVEEGRPPAWQSFENPSDTLVLDQNFTAASTPLVSAGNRRFALRLGKTYMALQMEFYGGRATATPPTTTYWQHTALEAQPENATEPPVYGRIDARGFFGLYVTEGQRVDVLSFDTFAQNLTGVVFRRMTLEEDGNLRAYYWTDETKAWKQEFKAISVRCELPTACGAYGLCLPGGEAQCQCLTNSTGTGTSTASSSSSSSPPCHGAADDGEDETTDLCGVNGDNGFDVVQRTRVSVAYKEWLPFETFPTSAECEQACAANCSCWGAAYNGASGYCYYLVGFPVQTVVYDSDERKVGYFKVRRTPSSARRRQRGMSTGVRAATAVLALVVAGLAMTGAYTGYRTWERKRRRREGMEQELAPGPYRDLKSLGSSNSSNRSFKA